VDQNVLISLAQLMLYKNFTRANRNKSLQEFFTSKWEEPSNLGRLLSFADAM